MAYGRGNQAWVVSGRVGGSLSGRALRRGDAADVQAGARPDCYARVYMDGKKAYAGRDGEPLFDVNSLHPAQLEAVEYYAGPAQTPLEYSDLDSTCGVLVLWTRRSP